MVWKSCPSRCVVEMSKCVFETVCRSMCFPFEYSVYHMASLSVSLCKRDVLEKGKIYKRVRLTILVTSRGLTERNSFQEYN